MKSSVILRAPKGRSMAYGDNRRTPKMTKRRRQAKKKARTQRRIDAGKAARQGN